MKKNILLIVLGILLVAGVILGLLSFRTGKASMKQFYIYESVSGYTYSEEEPENSEEAFVYSCKTEDCKIESSTELVHPYFFVYDSGFYLVDYENQHISSLNVDMDTYQSVQVSDGYALFIKKQDNSNVFDLYDFFHNQFLELETFDEPYQTFLNHYASFYVVNYLSEEGPNVYPLTSDSIFDQNFNLVSHDYYVQGTSLNDLVLTRDYSAMIVGGVNSSGYLDSKQFFIMDSSGNITYSSPEFLSLQSFIYDSELPNEIVYVLAVDTDNILKLYDLAGNVIVSFEEWSDSKNVCIGDHPTYFEGSSLEIMIGNGNLNGKRYVYDFQTDELTVEELDSPVCTK